MQRSRVFQSVYINHSLKRWEHSMTIAELGTILEELYELLAKGSWDKLRITRV